MISTVPPRRGREAFTLLELLASIAVILVLLGLLFAVSPSVIAQSRQKRCLSNQRTLYQAVVLYAADHAGRYPLWTSDPPDRGKNWHRSVWPYLSPSGTYENWGSGDSLRVYKCPANPSTTSAVSYAMNENLKDKRLSASAGKTLLLIDQAESQLVNGQPASLKQKIRGWHGGSNVVTFADGHAGLLALDEIPARDADGFFWGIAGY